VGIDAFDLQEYEIDITPWLGVLCDGNEHTFSMKVAGLADNGRTSATISAPVDTSWSVTGKIFVWLDDTNSITTGAPPSIISRDPTISVSQSQTQNSTGANGLNQTLTYTTSVSRSLTISSIITSEGGSKPCSWTQDLSHSDDVFWGDFGNTQTNRITTSGTDSSTGAVPYSLTYSYPLFANSVAIVTSDGNITLSALITRSKILTTSGTSIYPSGLQAFASLSQTSGLVSSFSGTTMNTTQNGTATQFLSPKTNVSFAFGSSTQDMRFEGVSNSGTIGMEPGTELYFRSVATVNGSVTRDAERIGGKQSMDFADDTTASEIVVSFVSADQAVGKSFDLQSLGMMEHTIVLGDGV
jgi:hypothetical protein